MPCEQSHGTLWQTDESNSFFGGEIKLVNLSDLTKHNRRVKIMNKMSVTFIWGTSREVTKGELLYKSKE